MIDINFFKKTRLLDGGMGQELLARGMPSNSTLWSASAILDEKYHPLVLNTHIDFIKAGAEIIVTTTFATRQKRLKENNLQDKFEYLNKKAGELSAKSIIQASDALQKNKIDTLVTLPINKSAVQSKIFKVKGHTDFFSKKFSGEVLMFMIHDKLKLALVTEHVPVKSISDILNEGLRQNLRYSVVCVPSQDNGFLFKQKRGPVVGHYVISKERPIGKDTVEVEGAELAEFARVKRLYEVDVYRKMIDDLQFKIWFVSITEYPSFASELEKVLLQIRDPVLLYFLNKALEFHPSSFHVPVKT